MAIKRKSGFADKKGNKVQKTDGKKQKGGKKTSTISTPTSISDDFVVDDEEEHDVDDDSSTSESDKEEKKTSSLPTTPSKVSSSSSAGKDAVADSSPKPNTTTTTNTKKTTTTSTKSQIDNEDSDDDIFDPALTKFKKNKTSTGSNESSEFLIILDLASLETVKTKKGDFQLLNCDDHIGLIRKFRKDPNEYRPDIIHQELMAVLDSPLNKAGKVRILVHTEKNVLFEVSSKTRIPRTFKRFSGLMVQLLHRLKIRSADGGDMLLKVVKNPIERHLPAGAKCIGFSDKGRLTTPMNFAKDLPKEGPIVLVFGAQATKGITPEQHSYCEELVSISEYPLSGIVAINRVLGAVEESLNIS